MADRGIRRDANDIYFELYSLSKLDDMEMRRQLEILLKKCRAKMFGEDVAYVEKIVNE